MTYAPPKERVLGLTTGDWAWTGARRGAAWRLWQRPRRNGPLGWCEGGADERKGATECEVLGLERRRAAAQRHSAVVLRHLSGRLQCSPCVGPRTVALHQGPHALDGAPPPPTAPRASPPAAELLRCAPTSPPAGRKPPACCVRAGGGRGGVRRRACVHGPLHARWEPTSANNGERTKEL